MEARKIRPAVCHFSISGWEGLMWDPIPWLYCSAGEASQEAPGHVLRAGHWPCLLADIPREPHHFSRHVWTYRWHWGILKQVCMGQGIFLPFSYRHTPWFLIMLVLHAIGCGASSCSVLCGHPEVKRRGSGVSTQTCSSSVWWLGSIHKAMSLSW